MESYIPETPVPAQETPEPTPVTSQEPMKTVNVLDILLTIPESWTIMEEEGKHYIVPDKENLTVLAQISVFAKDPSIGLEAYYPYIEENIQVSDLTYEPFFQGRCYNGYSDKGTNECLLYSVNNGKHVIMTYSINLSMKDYLINADYSNITLVPATPAPTPEPTPEPQAGISMQSFLALQCDMTLAEVQAILGTEGKSTSSYDIMG